MARTLGTLAPDSQKGTALYDAVTLSVARLKEMTSGSRVLVLLTDGHDLGSRSSLKQTIAAAQEANVVVYAIAAGARTDVKPLTALASETGGRRFDAADATGLGAAYRSLGRELDRTWQLSYLSAAREGDVTRTERPRRGSGVHDLAPDPRRGRKRGPRSSLRRREPDHRGRRRRPGRAAVRRGGLRRPPSPPLVRDHTPARAASDA